MTASNAESSSCCRRRSPARYLPQTQLLIGGEWGEGAQGRKRFATIDPATEEVIAEVSEATAADIDAAVGAARQALKRGAWPAMTGADRGRILNRIAAILRERFEEIVLIESLDAGKPLAATRRMDMRAAIDCLEYYAGWADKIAGEVMPGASRSADLCAAGAGRRRRDDRAVEFPADERDLEDRAGAGLRLHDRAQARGADAALGAVARRASRWRPGCRRAFSTSCRGSARRPAQRWSRIRASTRSRSRVRRRPDRSIMRAAADEHHQDRPRTRRQVAERRLCGCGYRRGGAPDGVRRLLQRRSGVLGGDARRRRREGPR